MKPVQRIADLHLDLSFESDDPRPQPMAEDDLLALAREHILSTLAETLEREDDGRHRHIARLDIDLGECAAYDYAAEIPPLLARLLSEALARHDSEAAAATSSRAAAEKREPLEHFLLTGHMPSPAGAAGDASRAPHERLLAPWLAAPAGDELKTLLRRCATSPGAVRRLAQQFESGTLRQVVQRVETPARAADWLSLINAIDAALPPTDASRRQDLRQFWEILLNQILGGASGTVSSAASPTLRQAATMVANGNAAIPPHAAALLRTLAMVTMLAPTDGRRAIDDHEAMAGPPLTARSHADKPYQGAQMRHSIPSRVDAQLAERDANDYSSSTGISAAETLWTDIERHIAALPGPGAALMLDAIRARAADSANRPAFLRRVSEALRHNQAIDLEAIEAAIAATSSAEERTTDVTQADMTPGPRGIEAAAYPTPAVSSEQPGQMAPSEAVPSIAIPSGGQASALLHAQPAQDAIRFRRTVSTPSNRTLLNVLRKIGICPVRRSPIKRGPIRAAVRPRGHLLHKRQHRYEPPYELSRFDEPIADERTIIELDASENVAPARRLGQALLDSDVARVSLALVGASSQTVLAAMRQVGNRPDVWLRIAHFPPTLLLQLTWAAAPQATNILLALQSTEGGAIAAAAGTVKVDLNDPLLWQRCLTWMASMPFEADSFRAALRATTLTGVTAPGMPGVASVPQPLTTPVAVRATAAPIEDDQPAPRAPLDRSSGHSSSGEQTGILRQALLDADEARVAKALASASNETVFEALRRIDDSHDIWHRIAHFSPALLTRLAATQREPHALPNQPGQPSGIVPASPHEPLSGLATSTASPPEPADRHHPAGDPSHVATLATDSPEAPQVEALWLEVSTMIAAQSSVAPDGGQPSLLARAVQARAAESHNPEAFLQAVLVTLRDQRMLDLDDIEEQVQHPEAAAIQETEPQDASSLLHRIGQQVGASAGGQRMMEAIALHAHASQAPAAYLRHVLEDVIASRPVDLDELDMLYGQLPDVPMAAPETAALPHPTPATEAATSTYATVAAAATRGTTETMESTAAAPAKVPNATAVAATPTTDAAAAAGAIVAVADTAVAAEADIAISAPMDVAIAAPANAAIVAATDVAVSASADAAISAPVDVAIAAPTDTAIVAATDVAISASADAAISAPMDVAIAAPTNAAIVATTDVAIPVLGDAAISAPVTLAIAAPAAAAIAPAANLAIADPADLAIVAAAVAAAAAADAATDAAMDVANAEAADVASTSATVAAGAAPDATTAVAMDAAHATAADMASTANTATNAQTKEHATSAATSPAPATVPVPDISPSRPQSASISTTAASAVLSTSTKRSGKTEIVVLHPAHPRRAPGGELARVLARHVPARRAALTALVREASDDIGDLTPATIHNIVKLLAGTEIQTMTRLASDVRALAARHLPHPPSAGLEFETAQFDLDWFFIQGRNFAAADYAHALAAWLGRHIAGAAEPLHEALHAHLGMARPAPPVPRATAISPTHPNHNGARTSMPYLGEDAPDLEIDALLVDNAGQVLIGPYMPRLFSMLGLTEAGQFKNAEAAERAVHLLQCVVGGPSDTPEAMLGLNKILCGVPAATAIAREITITEQERDTIEMMLRAIIEHWKKIGNTSPDGLRQSFLRRTGRMHLKEDAWYLGVEPGTFDMLLDSLPWSFSIIKHPWMERAVHVNWR